MIKVYTTLTCGYCKVLKMKMDAKGIHYEEVHDVEPLIEKGFTQVPVLEIDGIMHNYKEALEWVNRYGN